MKVIVVGGGLGGLSAAYRLSAFGEQVTVFEKAQRLGGRCATSNIGGFLFDEGAQFFRDSYDSTLKTAISLGLGPELRIPKEPVGLYSRGRLHVFQPRDLACLGAFPLFNARPSEFGGMLSLALRLARDYRKYDVRFPGRWTWSSDENAFGYLKRKIGIELAGDFAEPIVRFALGSDLSEVSVPAFYVALRMLFLDRPGYFAGGMGQLAEAYGGKIECVRGVSVERVVVEKNKVSGLIVKEEDDGKEKVLKARRVICAVPACEISRIAPDIQGKLRLILEECKYSPHMVVCLGFENKLPALPKIILNSSGQRPGFEFCRVSLRNKVDCAQVGQKEATAVYVGQNARALLGEKKENIVRKTVSLLEEIYQAEIEVIHSKVHKHNFGRPIVFPGHSRKIAELWSGRTGIEGLGFAGDWSYAPTVEGAVASGFLAADALLGTGKPRWAL